MVRNCFSVVAADAWGFARRYWTTYMGINKLMSIQYCEKHDRRFDTDFLDTCPLCEQEVIDFLDSREEWLDKETVAQLWYPEDH